jgi:hypothetical protein
MANKNWDHAYSEILHWALAHPGASHTLTLSNHHVGPRHFELRICVRDAFGTILAVARGRRAARYLDIDIENFVCENLTSALGLRPSQCRLIGDPDTGGPTYPLWDAVTEPGQSELPAGWTQA